MTNLLCRLAVVAAMATSFSLAPASAAPEITDTPAAADKTVAPDPQPTPPTGVMPRPKPALSAPAGQSGGRVASPPRARAGGEVAAKPRRLPRQAKATVTPRRHTYRPRPRVRYASVRSYRRNPGGCFMFFCPGRVTLLGVGF